MKKFLLYILTALSINATMAQTGSGGGRPATGGGSDATISFTDVTTNNASTTKHGFLPKIPTGLVTGQALVVDATGALIPINLGMPVTIGADQFITSTTGADITGLTWNLTGGHKYEIRGTLGMGCDNTGGISVAAVYSGTLAEMRINLFGRTTGGTVFRNDVLQLSNTFAGGSAFNTVASNAGVLTIAGTFTATTSGAFKIIGRVTTAGQTAGFYSAGTSLMITQLN